MHQYKRSHHCTRFKRARSAMSFLLILFLTIPLIVFLGLAVYYVYVQNSSSGKLINSLPGPKTIFLFGNMLTFHTTLAKIHERLYDFSSSYFPIYRVWLVTIPIIVLVHPDDIEILLTSTKHTSKKFVYEQFYPWLRTGLLISNGKKWQKRRKLLTPSFHFNILQKYTDITIEHSEKTIMELKSEGKETIKDLLPFCSQLTLNIICESAMGISLDIEKNESALKYKNAIYKMGNNIIYRLLRPYIRDWMVPFMPRYHKEIKEIVHDLDSFCINVINDRRAYHESTNYEGLKAIGDDNHKDSKDDVYIGTKKRLAMLDVLLAAEREGSIDESGIIEEVATFMFEGHDTTAVGLCFALSLLAENKEAQDLARQEVNNVLSRTNGTMKFESLQEMDYLQRCIKEAMRIYPSVPIFARTLENDLKLKTCTVPKGATVMVHCEHVHHNPEFWTDPLKFNPDRFLTEELKQRHPFSYVPFSGGPRNCIGQRFALLELKASIAQILYNFYLEPITYQADIKIQTDVILRPCEPIYAKFIRIDR